MLRASSTPPAAPPILCLGTNTTRLAGLVAHFPLDDRDTLIASEALSGRLSWRVCDPSRHNVSCCALSGQAHGGRPVTRAWWPDAGRCATIDGGRGALMIDGYDGRETLTCHVTSSFSSSFDEPSAWSLSFWYKAAAGAHGGSWTPLVKAGTSAPSAANIGLNIQRQASSDATAGDAELKLQIGYEVRTLSSGVEAAGSSFPWTHVVVTFELLGGSGAASRWSSADLGNATVYINGVQRLLWYVSNSFE